MTTYTKTLLNPSESQAWQPGPSERRTPVTAEDLQKTRPTPGLAARMGRFVWHLLAMLLAMAAGIAVFQQLVGSIPASSSYAVLILLTLTLLRLVIPFGLLLAIGTWLQQADEPAEA